jgi:hypothetical protein
MDGLDYIVPAHEDGGEERVEETARVDRTNSASSDGAYRGCSGTEEGAPVVVGLPREIPVAGEHGRAARRHPPPATTGGNKRRVALPGRRTHWYSGSSIQQIIVD